LLAVGWAVAEAAGLRNIFGTCEKHVKQLIVTPLQPLILYF
jgi:hypothetical protein